MDSQLIDQQSIDNISETNRLAEEISVENVNILSCDELNKLSSIIKEEKKNNFIKRIENGRKYAINHITQNCYDKMKEAAINGKDNVDIYSVRWEKDEMCEIDSDGNKRLFGTTDAKVKLLDLIKKDEYFLIELNKFFNKKETDHFYCGIRKENIEGNNKWIIYVSWSDKNKFKPLKKYNTMNLSVDKEQSFRTNIKENTIFSRTNFKKPLTDNSYNKTDKYNSKKNTI
jgi:hypothetical protein